MLELMNRYAHGLASIPIIHALKGSGCLAYMEEVETFSSEHLARKFSANRGCLEVALRMLVCLDWIRPTQPGQYAVTSELANARAIPDDILALYAFPFDLHVQGSAGQSLAPWLDRSQKKWNSEHPFLPDFLDGLLIPPLLLTLKAQGRLDVSETKDAGEATATLRLEVSPAVRDEVTRLFVFKEWGSESGEVLRLNRAGRYVIDRILVTSVLASYRPMFLQARELLFGAAAQVFALDSAGHETHLDRTLNVLGSGFQHERYFAAMSDLVIRLFDHDSYSSQPRYIADMGSGDGSLLRRLYETVRDRTRRGRVLDRHPLIPIAIDFHEKALAEASRTLEGIEHIALKGDIGDPLGLLGGLRAHGVEDFEHILHVRSFLDHNRSYLEPEDRKQAEGRSRLDRSGIYMDSEGNTIPGGEMIQSTVEHLRRWSHLVNDHGLIVLEVHCLPAPVIANFLDESESFHFDASQSLSHQYLIEAEAFLLCAAEAGLFCRDVLGFPKNMPFTRISLNHFQKRPYAVRHAREEDLPSWHELPQAWPQPSMRHDRGPAARAIESGVREFPEGQFVLESEGRILAAVSCERLESGDGDVIRLGSAHVSSDLPRSGAQDLLQFVQQYWALKSAAGAVPGIEECRSALAAGGAESSLARSAARDAAAKAAGHPFAVKDDLLQAERELGTFALQWGLAVIQKMGALRAPGETYEVDRLRRDLGIVPKYGRWFDALVRRLGAEGLVSVAGPVFETTEKVRGYALHAVEEQVAEFKESFPRRHPGCTGLLSFVACCLGRLEEILKGEIDVADVLFEDGSMDTFAGVFDGDAVSDHFNRIVADAVASMAVQVLGCPGASKVRIVEIGGGTGGTTAAVLQSLQPFADSTELCFSDISPSFIRYAKGRFARQYPWLDYRILNIEKDLTQQGFELHGFDVVVAANVLHDTTDIEVTLDQTRRLLKPGGLLVLNEFTAVKDCLFFSGALLQGYWLFEDPDRRLHDSCLLSVPQWKKALERTGFTVVESFALPTQERDAGCSQSVMLCAASGTASSTVAEQLVAEDRKQVHAASGEDAVGAGADRAAGLGKTEIIGRYIEQDILMLLGEERSSAYSAQRPLMEMGLDSIELVELKSLMRGRFGIKLPPAFLFENHTQEKIVKAMAAVVPDEQIGELVAAPVDIPESPGISSPAESAVASRPLEEDAVAIVGIACRFAGGATSPEAFWKLLESGGEGIGPMPADRWQWPDFIDVEGRHKGIDRGGFLERIDEFDARFFRTSPKEAELMDPQQRLLLELGWEAMEDGGHRPSELAGRRIGVFIGVCQSDYRDVLVEASEAPEGYVGSGTAYAMLANRLSYFYDFKGPSLTVDTACSSSLFALHDAVTAMQRGDCEEALVGGVNLLCSPTISISYYQAGMLSPTGRCRTFDAAADGYVRGEGGAMLLLKPLAKAIEHGDAVYGLVKGTAVNHGGQAVSLTAPKPDAQAEVVETAWRRAGASPDTAGYVEAHGTGTPLGDPIEVSGLTEAFRRLYQAQGKSWPAAKPHCGLGSVKSNVGHLEGAAGLAGLIKLLMAIQHEQIPRTINFQRLNPEIDLHGSPFYVVERNQAWPRFRDEQGRELPRRAGVSSFGFGGANAHAVIEEYRSPTAGAGAGRAMEDAGQSLIPLSARTQEQLIERARQLLAFLEQLDHKAQKGTGRKDASLDRVLDDLGGLLRDRFGLGDECTPDLEWEEMSWGPVETRLFLTALEEAQGIRLPPRALIEFPSLRSLAESIVHEHGAPVPGPAAETSGAFPDASLRDLAYTLQAGREPMAERVVFLVGSAEELVSVLRSYLAGDQGMPGCFRGYARPPQEARDRQEVEAGLARRDLAKLASLWSQGVEIDWERLARVHRPRRAHLPTYPFARDRHWAPRARAEKRARPARLEAAASHPLLNQRNSIPEYRFSSVLSGGEFFLADHVIQGRRVLPAVAYLEMVRTAVERTSNPSLGDGEEEGRGGIWLKSVAWVRPLFVDEKPARVSLRLTPEGNGELSFEIYSRPEGVAGEGRDEVFHGQGRAGTGMVAAAPVLDVAKARARCARAHYSSEDCYRAFAAMGYEYGPAHRGIEEMHVGADEILARLTLPASLSRTRDELVLHPAMADAAVQATIGFALADRRNANDPVEPALPFELQSAEIFRACTSSMWASIRRGDGARDRHEVGTFDVDLCDEAGRLCARFKGWSTRIFKGSLQAMAPAPAAAALREGEPRLGEMLLTPVWEPVEIERQDASRQAPGRMAIVGGTDHQKAALLELHPEARPLPLPAGHGIEQMRQTIASWGEIGHVVWIVPDHRPDSVDDESLITAQRDGVLFCFRLIKSLLAEGYGDRPLAWTVITTGTQAVHAEETASPAHAGVHGLIGSMAKEQTDWDVRLIDLPSSGSWPWRDLLALAGDPHGNAVAYRDHRWYRQRLVPHRPSAETAAAAAYRPGGVYVVIGGAGGIGEVWSEALLRRLPAQLVWIGRRPLDDSIQARLDRLAGLGPAPLYIAADATDRKQLEGARETIKRKFGRIDGLIHAAMVVQDHSLANMTEDELGQGLAAKVDVCVRLAQAFGREPLDFVLFFSSINAFSKWPGQSNYSAGCTFKDAFAHRLAAAWPCRVRVVNWGYWSVGALASERYRFLMARKGLGSIELPGAMQVLDQLLSGPVAQLAYLNATGPKALEGIGFQAEERVVRETVVQDLVAGMSEIMGRPRDAAANQLLAYLRLRVAETLGADEASLDSRSRPFADALLGEFGMDSLSSNSLRNKLRQELGVDLPVHRIIGEKVHKIVDALYEQLLLKHVSNDSRPEDDEESETFVF
jgi:acyl transferase domain-containing protein/ubiquinone/menaquinone biosynthesis C-methylase UbiE/acyl carrier protein